MAIQSVLFSFSLLFYILLFYYFNMVFKAIFNLDSTPDNILTVKISPIFSRRPAIYSSALKDPTACYFPNLFDVIETVHH